MTVDISAAWTGAVPGRADPLFIDDVEIVLRRLKCTKFSAAAAAAAAAAVEGGGCADTAASVHTRIGGKVRSPHRMHEMRTA